MPGIALHECWKKPLSGLHDNSRPCSTLESELV
jgi:hypothetical protein